MSSKENLLGVYKLHIDIDIDPYQLCLGFDLISTQCVIYTVLLSLSLSVSLSLSFSPSVSGGGR